MNTATGPAAGEATPILRVAGLSARIAGQQVVEDVSFSVPATGITALLGRNGVGKTTLLKSLMGLVPIKTGSIEFDGKAIERTTPYERARSGMGFVPQGREIFARLTVEENLRMGAEFAGHRDYERELAHVTSVFPRLKERLHQRGGTLSGGEQQMLAIARALMSRPKLLLLDEPSLGLAPRIIGQIGEVIAEINRQGTSVLLVEQNATMALGVAHLAYVLDVGEVSLSGDARELARTDEVQRLYLGHDGDGDGTPRRRATSGRKLSRWQP